MDALMLTPTCTQVCHCIDCRRATGGAYLTASICPAGVRSSVYKYVALLLIQAQGLQVEGSEYKKTYIDTAVDSGTHLKRVFCSE